MTLKCLKLFENESSRVKSISFHSSRSWILVSLHSGLIQLWDYRLGCHVSAFHEHEGPVRSVSFHPCRSLFVSGGDDLKIKVWNPQPPPSPSSAKDGQELTINAAAGRSKSLFTLLGHMDYIRSVEFHAENPWILSASDDQTIRIWNWQARTCISVLTGHNHYVMHAAFGPFNRGHMGNYVASASLDQEVRIWDCSGLKRKHAPGSGKRTSASPDLFALNEVVVKHVLKGHDRGVNFVSWHPSGTHVVSCSDDRQVKTWQLDGFRAWEVDSYSGHFNNVSSAIYTHGGNAIISNSEDRTMRVWDNVRKTCLCTIQRDMDRFWQVASHPHEQEKVFAAAHDGGFLVFKLERERPAWTCFDGFLLYIQNKQFRVVKLLSLEDVATIGYLNRPGQSIIVQDHPQQFHYNPIDGSVLFVFGGENPMVEYYPNVWMPSDTGYQNVGSLASKVRIPARACMFHSRNRFLVLESHGIGVYNSSGDMIKNMALPNEAFGMFCYSASHIVVLFGDKIGLFDVQLQRITHETFLPPKLRAKHVFVSKSREAIVLYSKHQILIYNRELVVISSVMSETPIKSVYFAEEPHVVYYSTHFHLKYWISSANETGILCQLPTVAYIVGVFGDELISCDRPGQMTRRRIDLSEIRFKCALERNDLENVTRMIEAKRMAGQGFIAYLKHKGHAKLALEHTQDPITRFELALECGQLNEAFELAKALNQEKYWKKLGEEAWMMGSVELAEMCYSRLLDGFDHKDKVWNEHSYQLLFMYLVTGQKEKLERLAREFEERKNIRGLIVCLLILGNNHELGSVLKAQGLECVASRLEHHRIHRSLIVENERTEGWSLGEDPPVEEPQVCVEMENLKLDETVDHQEISSEVEDPGWEHEPASIELPRSSVPLAGIDEHDLEKRQSRRVIDHVMIGDFEIACQMLNQKYGIRYFGKLKEMAMRIYRSSRIMVPGIGTSFGNVLMLDSEQLYPLEIDQKLKQGYDLTTRGKFQQAHSVFQQVLQTQCLVDNIDPDEWKRHVAICVEYLTALKLEMRRKTVSPDQDIQKHLLYSVLMTHCQLRPLHRFMAMRSAFNLATRCKAIKLAQSLGARLLDLDREIKPDLMNKITTIIQTNPSDSQLDLEEYMPLAPFKICHSTLTPVYFKSDRDLVDCSYCAAEYRPPNEDGFPCHICELTMITAK